MLTVNMHQAKTNLSRLVEALVSGKEPEVTIARNGKPAVVMTAIPDEKPKRKLGLLKGKVEFDYDAFQALDAKVLELFEAEVDRKAKLYGE